MTIENNSIAVIIVNFNAGNYLLKCVSSLLETALPLEVIISDNGSTDNSLAVVEQVWSGDNRLTIIENKTNLGFSRGNNIGVAKTQSDYLLFLNPDCVVSAGTLEFLQEIMDGNPDAGMAGCLIRNSDGSVQATCVRSIPTPWNSLVRVLHLSKIFRHLEIFKGLDLAARALPKKITAVEGISGAFMFVRRSALLQVGLLDENYFLYCEDIDWMMRFTQLNWKILFVPNVAIIHERSVCSKQTPFRVLWFKSQGMIRFYKKFFRHRYPLTLMWLVYLAIWLRFMLLSVITAGKYLATAFQKRFIWQKSC